MPVIVMENDAPSPVLTREFIAKVIINRGRRVDLYEYLKTNPEELLRGTIVAGTIGSGKTKKALRIVQAALASGFGVLVFDPSIDYQGLLNIEPQGVVMNSCEFYQNPLEPPPGMSLEEWAPTFIQVFAQNFGHKDPSIAILQQAMKHLVELGNTRNEPATLSKLYEEVINFESRGRNEDSSKTSVMNRIESVLNSELGRSLNVAHGFSPTDLEEGLLVVRLRPIGIERVHELLVGVIVAKLFAYRAWKQTSSGQMGKNVLIVLEEAHRYLREERRSDRRGERLYLERALVECRKLGVGFMVVDQLPHEISRYVLSSCNMWIICRLMDAEAQRTIRDALCLDDVWARNGLMELPVGAAFLRVEHIRELESVSPLAQRSDDGLLRGIDARGLPALVTTPESEDTLIGSLENGPIESLMFQNPRYLKYFQRNLREDADRIRESLSSLTRTALDRFIERVITDPKRETREVLESFGVEAEETSPRSMHLSGNKGGRRGTLERQEIDTIKVWLDALTNEKKRAILEHLKTTGSSDTPAMRERFSCSKSALSRSLRGLEKNGLVERASRGQQSSTVYAITDDGRRVLTWCGKLCGVRGCGASGERINILREDCELFLQLLRKNLDLREKSAISGWRGNIQTIQEYVRLEHLIGFFLGRGSDHTETAIKLDSELLNALSRGLSSGVLKSLLSTTKPDRLERIIESCEISERSVRRHIRDMERDRLLQRIWYQGERGVKLNEDWRLVLTEPALGDSYTVPLPRRLVEGLCCVALEAILLGVLMGHETRLSQFDEVNNLCRIYASKFLDTSCEGV